MPKPLYGEKIQPMKKQKQKTKKQKIPSVSKDVDKLEPTHTLLLGMYYSTAVMETSLAIP